MFLNDSRKFKQISLEQANDGISVVYIYVDLEDRKRLKFIDRNDH